MAKLINDEIRLHRVPEKDKKRFVKLTNENTQTESKMGLILLREAMDARDKKTKK